MLNVFIIFISWSSERQDYNSENVIKRYASKDHQGRHSVAGLAVDAVNKGYSKKCCAASVGPLQEFSAPRLRLHTDCGKYPDKEYAGKGGSKAEEYKLRIPCSYKVLLRQISKQQRRKPYLEHEFVHEARGLIVYDSDFIKDISKDHQQENRKSCI